MTNKMEPITKEKLILVEGNDEVNFFQALTKYMGVEDDFQVIDFKGKDRLKAFVYALKTQDNFQENVTSMIIVRDADKNIRSATDELKEILFNFGARKDSESGVLYKLEDLSIGFYLMPMKDKEGELEDLVLSSLQDNLIFNAVESYLESLKEITLPSDPSSAYEFPRKPSKAKLQIYFSSMKESDPRMGLSAKRKYIDFSNQVFMDIRRFIGEM